MGYEAEYEEPHRGQQRTVRDRANAKRAEAWRTGREALLIALLGAGAMILSWVF